MPITLQKLAFGARGKLFQNYADEVFYGGGNISLQAILGRESVADILERDGSVREYIVMPITVLRTDLNSKDPIIGAPVMVPSRQHKSWKIHTFEVTQTTYEITLKTSK